MAKLSQHLRQQIVNQITAKYEPTCDILVPPLPQANVLCTLIEGLDVYRETTNRKNLRLTDEVGCRILPDSETYKLPKRIPIIMRGDFPLTEEIKLESSYGELEITARKNSAVLRRAIELAKLRREYSSTVSRQLREYNINTTAQMVNSFPEHADLPCLVDAIAHEKAVRANNVKVRKEAPPLEVIEVDQTAIAKARLLGAKYVT